VRAARRTQQLHVGFFRCAAAFAVVAADARAHEIFPCIGASTRTWKDMVERQQCSCRTAVLAPMAIATKNVFTGKLHAFVRNADVCRKADDAGERMGAADRMDNTPRALFDDLGFCEKREDESFFYTTDADGLVALIQNEYFAAKLAERHFHCAEFRVMVNLDNEGGPPFGG